MFKNLLPICLILLSALTLNLKAQENEGDSVVGLWLTGNKDAKVEIYKNGDKYDGKIVWLKTPLNEEGQPKLDKENPEEELQTRPILGLQLLKDFEYDEDFEWEDGEIYDPKSGKTYSCNMELLEDKKTLEVRGYIGISLLGRTQTWERVTE
ncbi:MAG: DUF2147 domain-containing protein [Melioribacteraceae bacterium]|nr:DUF2147 domain-containing protein [Melioribacteraceae bacterium]